MQLATVDWESEQRRHLKSPVIQRGFIAQQSISGSGGFKPGVKMLCYSFIQFGSVSCV